jgi:hypothetical protein
MVDITTRKMKLLPNVLSEEMNISRKLPSLHKDRTDTTARARCLMSPSTMILHQKPPYVRRT